MKAQELMIGDWVMLDKTYPPTSNKPTQLTLQDMLFIEQGKECKPIPLTDEIFKKNGFWEGGGGYEKFHPKFGHFTTWKSKIEDVQCILVALVEKPLYYVHELQHALRLCGLNELADNFKV